MERLKIEAGNVYFLKWVGRDCERCMNRVHCGNGRNASEECGYERILILPRDEKEYEHYRNMLTSLHTLLRREKNLIKLACYGGFSHTLELGKTVLPLETKEVIKEVLQYYTLFRGRPVSLELEDIGSRFELVMRDEEAVFFRHAYAW